MVESDPPTAAEFFGELADTELIARSDDDLRDAAHHIARRWSDYDPVTATKWALSLPQEGEIQHGAIEAAADHWVRNDPQAAAEWIAELPAGRTRDIATERLVDHSSEADPEYALQWALSTSNREHQTDMLHHVFEQWNEADPQAARSSFDATTAFTGTATARGGDL